jgi:cation diffusion facilitator CzcD-associated flavoprotein CzcO
MRQRVNDPELAEKLIPTDHGFGIQRVPLETGYLEAYNRPNVTLVDIAESPLERVTPHGIKTTEHEFEFDLIIYATGFDAITGAYDRIDITGVDGVTLRDKWRDGLSTFLGMLNHGFPNLLMPAGPQSGSASTNFPRGIEVGVDWCTELLEHARDKRCDRIEARLEGEQEWTDHVRKMYSIMLMRKAKSWFTGYNSNVEGHEEGKIRYFVYNGGSPKYLKRVTDEAKDGYPGVQFSPGAPSPRSTAQYGPPTSAPEPAPKSA